MVRALLFLFVAGLAGCKENAEDQVVSNENKTNNVTNQVTVVAEDTDPVVVGKTYQLALKDNYNTLSFGNTWTDYYIISKKNGYVHFRETGLTDRTSSMSATRSRVTYIRVGMMEENRFKWMLKQGDLWRP